MSEKQSERDYDRLPWLDILKGIGIILVVTGHVYMNKMIHNWIYSFHMPLFFFGGGYLYTFRKTYKKKKIIQDLKRRIQTIVIPYFSFGFCVFLYWAAIERRFRDSPLSVFDSLIGLFRGQYDYLDFNVHLWFLPCFFCTAVLYNVLMNISKKTAYIVTICMSIIYLSAPLPQLIWGWDRVFQYIGFYAAGSVAAEIHPVQYLKRNHSPVMIQAVRTGLSAVLIAVSFLFAYFNLTTGIMWFVTGLTGTFGVVLAAICIGKNKALQYFGRISLVILCVHGPIYRVVIKIVSIILHMGTDDVRKNFFFSIVIVMITLAVSSSVYETVIRIAPWMIGKKKPA